jgi:preprotein translocase subunit SecE
VSEKKKLNLFQGIGHFFKELTVEIKKIIWPTPKTVFQNTGIVLLMIFIVGIFVFVLDSGFLFALNKIMSVSK